MFFNCISLTSVELPDGVTAIGDWAFSDCEALTSLTIPGGVTAIGEWAFELSDALTLAVELSSYAEQYAVEKGIAYAYFNLEDGLNG